MEHLERKYSELKKQRKKLTQEMLAIMKNEKKFMRDNKTKDIITLLESKALLKKNQKEYLINYLDSYAGQVGPDIEVLKKTDAEKIVRRTTFSNPANEAAARRNPESYKIRYINLYKNLTNHSNHLIEKRERMFQLEQEMHDINKQIEKHEKIADIEHENHRTAIRLKKRKKELRGYREKITDYEKNAEHHAIEINRLTQQEKNILNWLTKERLAKVKEVTRIAKTMRKHGVIEYDKQIKDLKKISFVRVTIGKNKIETATTKHFDLMKNSLEYARTIAKSPAKKHKEQKEAYQDLIDVVDKATLSPQQTFHIKNREIIKKIEEIPKIQKQLHEHREQSRNHARNARNAREHLRRLRSKKI